MNSVKILHCADLHLGIERLSLDNKSKARRAEVRRTFHTIMQLAKEENIDLLLIAGDLFDTVRVSEELVTEVKKAFEELKPVQIALVSGNHDPATPDSVYLRENFWPDNVWLFTGPMQVKELPQIGVRLLGAGFTGSYSTSSMLRRAVLADDELINIGIMHADLVAEGAGSEYNPLSVRQIENSGLRYLALGHIHKRSNPAKAGFTTYAYSGCPEGQKFGEDGVQGVYIAEVSKDSCDVRFVPVCSRRYTTLSVDLSGAREKEEVLALIRAAMQRANGEDYIEQIYKVTLKGAPETDFIAAKEDIKLALDDVWYVEIKDRTRPHVDEEELLTENSLRGIFVKQMQKLRDQVPEEEREYALRLGLKAFYGELEIED